MNEFENIVTNYVAINILCDYSGGAVLGNIKILNFVYV